MTVQTDDEGLTDDLVEKLRSGSLTSTEVKKELKRRGLLEPVRPLLGFGIIIGLLLGYISNLTLIPNLEALNWLASLPIWDFPLAVRCFAAIFLIIGLIMTVLASRLLSHKGGLGDGDRTVMFIREGPYKVVRHPIALGMFGLFVLPPFIFSKPLLYTPITAVGQLVLIITLLLEGRKAEETNNIKKWGEAYKCYMQEVPKFNIFLGLWKLVRKYN